MHKEHRWDLFLFSALGFLFLWVLYANAWLSDDAYITLRVVDNFTGGYGLRWNVAERVQVYTHPVWALILSGVYFFTREAFFTTIITGMLFSLAAYGLLVYCFHDSRTKVLFFSVLLLSSKSFMDYTTSGLENPLSYFLTVSFFILFLYRKSNALNLRLILLCYSLLLLCRPDFILIYTPGLLYYLFLFQKQEKINPIHLLYGLSPVILWEIFSLLYYGSFFPNTALGKLNTSLPFSAKAGQGIQYGFDSMKTDPVTLLMIIVTVCLISIKNDLKLKFAGVGVALYLFYVIAIGGDFMGGRFFNVPFLIAVIVLTGVLPERKSLAYPLIVSVLFAGLISPFSPVLSGVDYRLDDENVGIDLETGIADERGFYYRVSGLRRILRNEDHQIFSDTMLKEPNRFYPATLIKTGLDYRGQKGVTLGVTGVGLMGYYAGPSVHIVDKYAICDPLLARLKFPAGKEFRPGHLARDIPDGYLESLVIGRNVITNPDIARLYDHVLLLTTADLFHRDRLMALMGLSGSKP